MKYASIITVGSEIVEGIISDRNSKWLSERLKKLGYLVKRVISVGDDLEDIVDAITFALRDTCLLILTGGLGPTKDDVTREAVSRALGRPLVFSEKVFEKVAERVEKFAGKVVEGVKKEAMLIDGAVVLYNDVGSAPGQCIELHGKRILILPGPPMEMQNVFSKAESIIKEEEPIYTRVVKFYGVRESILEDELKDLIYSYSGISVATQADYVEGVKLRFTAPLSLRTSVDNLVEELMRTKYKINIYGLDDETMEEKAVKLLGERGETMAAAESCTGGVTLWNNCECSRSVKGF